MSFEARRTQADVFVEILDSRIWHSLADRISIVPFGYETHIPETIRQQLRYLRTVTARFVRFAPDFFLIDRARPDRMYLLEYKTTQTPLYSLKRVSQIGREAGLPDLRWQDLGQMEADAYDNYLNIQTMGARMVILNYCAYHERLLLCDFIQTIHLLHRDRVTTQTQTGSRTPFVNFDCNSMRDFKTFVQDEHGLTLADDLYQSTLAALQTKLPVQHHHNSPFHPGKGPGS